MGNRWTRWLRSKAGKGALAGLFAVLLIVLVAGQLLGWWPALADVLRGTAGVQGVQPSQVVLTYFGGEAATSQVTAFWETEIEVNNQGFNLYRSEPATGAFVQLNSDLIASQAQGGPAGASYQFVDPAPPGGAVEYRLESLDAQGMTTYLGATIVEVDQPDVPPQSPTTHRLFLPLIRR